MVSTKENSKSKEICAEMHELELWSLLSAAAPKAYKSAKMLAVFSFQSTINKNQLEIKISPFQNILCVEKHVLEFLISLVQALKGLISASVLPERESLKTNYILFSLQTFLPEENWI